MPVALPFARRRRFALHVIPGNGAFEPMSELIPWQPDSWPEAPAQWNQEFEATFGCILRVTILGEINSTFADVIAQNSGRLNGRGHVLALSVLSGIDAVSSYSYASITASARCKECGRGDKTRPRYVRFIEEHFPPEYRPHAVALYTDYRNAAVHSWHLFKVGLVPGDECITADRSGVAVGLKNLRAAFERAVHHFLGRLTTDSDLQASVLIRYRSLRQSAMPSSPPRA